MKKLILFAAILFAGVSIVKADGSKHTDPKGNSDANLTVTLSSVQAILVNKPGVHLEYLSIDNYKDGVKSEVANHLNIYSTGGYSVSVKYGNTLDSYTGNSEVDASKGAGKDLFESIKVEVYGEKSGATTTDQLLTTGGKTIIESTNGTLDTNYSVRYQGAINNAYAQYIQKGTKRVYTADVTYTIAPK